MKFESVFNNGTMKKDGSGSTALDIILNNDIETVITGDMREGAYKTLSDVNIKIITGLNGNIGTTIKEFKLNEIEQCPLCDSINLVRDYSKMEVLCKNCGLRKKV
jgi:predicted Fe-Mo cluster-binding NifX family protein